MIEMAREYLITIDEGYIVNLFLSAMNLGALSVAMALAFLSRRLMR